MAKYYRPVRLVNGKLRRVVTDEDGNIIKDPTDEQIRLAIIGEPKIDMRKGRKCNICKSATTYIDIYGKHHWYKDYDIGGNSVGWLCNVCNSRKNYGVQDSMRFNRVFIDSDEGRGLLGECVVATVLKIYDCSHCGLCIKNRRLSYDLEHKEYGKIDVKTSSPNVYDALVFTTGRKIECNYYFCLGFNKEFSIIENVYIIPNDGHIPGIKVIWISRNSSRLPKYNYEQYEEDPRIWNDAFHSLDIDNCRVFKKRV